MSTTEHTLYNKIWNVFPKKAESEIREWELRPLSSSFFDHNIEYDEQPLDLLIL